MPPGRFPPPVPGPRDGTSGRLSRPDPRRDAETLPGGRPFRYARSVCRRCEDPHICAPQHGHPYLREPYARGHDLDFHRNRYRSPRGPSDAAVTVRMPRSLSYDLTALSLVYEEPKCSILLRIIEQYVDSHRDDVELGEWRLAHYSPGGWGGDDSETRLTLSEDTPDEGGTENRDAGHPPTE